MGKQSQRHIPDAYRFHDAHRDRPVKSRGRWADVLREARDAEVVRLKADGLTQAQIGRAVGIDPGTVRRILRAV